MPLLSPAELARLQAYAATMLTDDCTIQSNTPTKDSMGTNSDNWSNTVTVKGALIGPHAGQEVVIDARIGVLAIWTVLLPFGTTVVEGNRIVSGGHTLTVQADLTPQSYAVLASVRASEVK